MDIRELQMGDWVYNTHHQKNIQITAYDFFTHGHTKDGEQYLTTNSKPTIGEDLIPIPLTAEILEKNGFVKNVWNIYTAPACCLSVERVKDYFFLRLGTFQLCNIEYVHELQHFLRDFKTNKEITL